MNPYLYKAKQIVISLQEALGLDPCTTPESEFRAELHAFAEHIKSDCARLSHPQADVLQLPDGTKLPSITIMVTPDDIIDGLGPNVLMLTYFGGNDSPVGSHHGLSIVLNPAGQLLYRRLPGQDPIRQWTCNALTHGKPDFEFPPYISDRSWMNHTAFSGLLQEHDVAEFLSLTNVNNLVTEPTHLDYVGSFVAEIAYLGYWNTEHYSTPSERGITLETDVNEEDSQIVVTITCGHCDIEPISLVYVYDSESDDYSLMIIDSDNIVYQREAGQDPLTEWVINEMANDPLITDEYGNPLFIGDPIQE